MALRSGATLSVRLFVCTPCECESQVSSSSAVVQVTAGSHALREAADSKTGDPPLSRRRQLHCSHRLLSDFTSGLLRFEEQILAEELQLEQFIQHLLASIVKGGFLQHLVVASSFPLKCLQHLYEAAPAAYGQRWQQI